MFTQSCLIRKNTKELRNYLEKLGYKVNKLAETKAMSYGILCNKKVAVGLPKDSIDFNLDEYLEKNPHIVDCKDNEDLFCAVVALRDDDVDKYQWFTNKSNSYWWLCTDFDSFIEDYKPSNEDKELKLDYWHKATVQELVEHFKYK